MCVMQRFVLALIAGCAVFAMGLAGPPLASQQRVASALPAEPVLIELFTSQGCSSCPPADRLAARLAQEPGLVVISRPVTYWDRLGWKDTLAREDNTRLQRAYAGRGLAGQNGVYTPQVAVDGRFGTVGSDEPDIRRFAAAARSRHTAAIVANPVPAGYAVGLGGTTETPAELVLIAVSRAERVSIGRGENGGTAVVYTNVLRAEKRVDEWNGGAKSLTVSDALLSTPGANRHALVLRIPNGGAVLAARWLD